MQRDSTRKAFEDFRVAWIFGGAYMEAIDDKWATVGDFER